MGGKAGGFVCGKNQPVIAKDGDGDAREDKSPFQGGVVRGEFERCVGRDEG